MFLDKFAVTLLHEEFLPFQSGYARVDNHVIFEIEDTLQLSQGHIQQDANAAWNALEEPDMRHRACQFDVSKPLTPHFGLDNLDAAFLAHDAAMFHALVFSAVAFPVLRRAENLGAEQPVTLRLEGAIVDGFRLLDFAVRPRTDLLRRRETNTDRTERSRVFGFLIQVEYAIQRRPPSAGVGACVSAATGW